MQSRARAQAKGDREVGRQRSRVKGTGEMERPEGETEHEALNTEGRLGALTV